MKRVMALAALGLLLGYGMAQEAGATAEGEAATSGLSFGQMDADGDGNLNMGEFGSALYELVKPEGAEGLSQEDFETAVERLGLSGEEFSFEAVDVNQDGLVTDDQEFIPTVAAALFEQWTEEGAEAMTAAEFNRGLFGMVDADSDGTITPEEFEVFAEWFGTDYQTVAGGSAGELRPDTFLEDMTRGAEGAGAEGAEGAEGAADGEPATEGDAGMDDDAAPEGPADGEPATDGDTDTEGGE